MCPTTSPSGNARQYVLNRDEDRAVYLKLLRENIEAYKVSLLGYCLMSNHVHLIAVPTLADGLALAFRNAHGRYAAYWKAIHGASGHAWQGRFYSCPLDEVHLWAALRYTELNPVRADIIGLYLNPPQHAAVFCVDEKTAIQALDRLDPVLPLSPGRIERHGFEYRRHGTLSLYAALETSTGRVHGKTTARHTSQDFVAFLEEVVAQCPADRQIHIILDNLSAHKTKLVDEFLQNNSRVKFHFTPTYSSWLNQVELWFGKIERDLIARGVFTSVNDLARKIRRYIQAYSANAKPIQWKYSDPNRRIRSNELTATGH